MNKFFVFCLCALGTMALNVSYGQTTRKGQFTFFAGFGISKPNNPKINVISGLHELEMAKGETKNLEFFNERGNLMDLSRMMDRDMSVGLQYRFTNPRTENGFMIDARINSQQNTANLTLPRGIGHGVACTPSLRRALRSQGASLSVARFLESGFYLRVSGQYSTNFKSNRDDNFYALNAQRPYYFVSDGNGSLRYGDGTIMTTTAQPQPVSWSVVPELGYRASVDRLCLEAALSYQVAVSGNVIYSETYRFYNNRYKVGENRLDFSNGAFLATLRLGYNLFPDTKTNRKPRQRPEPSYRPLPDRTSPSRFENITTDKPTQLNVLFELTEAKLLRSSYAELDEVAQWLNSNPRKTIRLEGHTDKIGDATLNYELSIKRLDAVKAYLVKKGIAASRIQTIGYGDTKLLYPSPDQRNRRVEMRVLN